MLANRGEVTLTTAHLFPRSCVDGKGQRSKVSPSVPMRGACRQTSLFQLSFVECWLAEERRSVSCLLRCHAL